MKNEFPLISVIMIVKNGEAFLKEAIDSVLQQSYSPIEVLIIDGGSVDKTSEIVKSYPEVRYILQNDEGISSAYNQGILSAKGEFVSFNSSDDIWLPKKLEIQYGFFLQNPELQFSITYVQFFADKAENLPAHFRVELLHKTVPGYIMESLLARKSIFEKTGLFNTEMPVAEDTEWYSKVIDMKIPYHIVKDVLVLKRIHQSNSHLNPSIQLSSLMLKILKNSLDRKRK
jgi:glycosyltransferase involved in cell wall biosynthesis